MKKLLKKISVLSVVNKLELAAAVILTLAVLIGAPVFAWFATGTSVEVMTKIREPENLDIKSGNYEPVKYIDLRNIDIHTIESDTPGQATYSAKYVFSVSAGEYKIPYKIQVAHTTNIPFTYKLFKATRENGTEPPEGDYAIYHSYNRADAITYYSYNSTANLLVHVLNGDNGNENHFGRVIAKGKDDDYYKMTYNDSLDDPQIYAVPIYMQTDKISSLKDESTYDYFVLELEWEATADTNTNFKKWNTADNNKETDIIYICAAKATE